MGLLDRFRRADADDASPYADASRDSAEEHNASGLEMMRRGLIHEALEEFRRGLRSNPDSAEIYYNMGVAHDYLSETKRAAECYERAVRLAPDFVEAYCGLGAAYSRLGKGLEAIKTC